MGRTSELAAEMRAGSYTVKPLSTSTSRTEEMRKELGGSSSVSSTKTKKPKKRALSSLDNRPKSETKKTTAAPSASATAKAQKTDSKTVTKKPPVYVRSTKAAPVVDPSAYGYDPMVAQDLQNRAAQSKPGVARSAGARRGGQTVYRVEDTPSLGSRVAGTVSGAAKTYGGSMAGFGAFALEAAKKLDESVSTSHNRAVNDAEHAREARLKLLSDSVQRRHGVGAPMTQEERDRLRKQAEWDEARARIAQEYQDKVHAPLTAASDALYRKGAEMEAAGQEDIERAKAGLGAVGRFGVDVGVAGLQMGMDYIPALLTGGGSALAPMFLRSAGGAAITGKESGADFSDRAVYALGSGAISAATEQISNIAGPFRRMFGAGVADQIASRLVSRFGENQAVQIMSRAAQTAAGRAALAAFGEGFEEVAEAVLQTPLQRATIDPDAKFDPVQAGYDFLVGAALGGLGGAVDVGKRQYAQNHVQSTYDLMQGIVQDAQQPHHAAPESVRDTGPQKAETETNGQTQTETDPLLKIIQDIQRDQQARPGSILLNGDQLAQINREIAKQQAAPVDVDSLLKGRARLDYEQLSPDSQAAVDKAYEQGTAGMDAEGRIFRINPEDHIDRRDTADIGRRRSLNAFQFDHPELHRFFVDAATWLKSDLARGQKGGQIESAPGVLSDGITPSTHEQYRRTSRITSEPVARLLDSGMSYARIEKALDAIIKDRGQENYADAKQVELVLDDILTNGYADMDGRPLPGIQEYVDAKNRIAGSLNAEQGPDLGIMGQEIERLYGQPGQSSLTPDGQDGTIQETSEMEETPYENRTRAKREARPEGRREFLERSRKTLSGGFESGDVAYGIRPAHSQPQQVALEIRQALIDLGVPSAIIDGRVEINYDGHTQVQSVMQTASAGGKLVLIGPDVFGNPMNAAGHEAFHFWIGTETREAFEDILADQIIFNSEAFKRFQQSVAEDYFGGEVLLSDQMQTNGLLEELYAFIAGNLHSGENETALRSMLRDYDAVKAAWNQLAEYGRSHPAEMPTSIQWGQDAGPDLGIMGQEIERLYGKADVKTESQAFVDPDAPADDGLGAANSHFDQIGVAEERYGTLPEGEKAVRPDDIPRQTTDTNKVSLLARTIKGAGVVPDSFIPVLEKAVLDGKFSYIPHTNAETAAKARQMIEYKGWQRAFADFHSDVERGRASDAITAMGVELFNNAVNAGDISAALDLSIDLQKTVRNAGQAAQAVRILKQSEPAHRLYMIQRSVQSMVDAMNLPEGSVKLDETLLKNYLDAASEEQRDAVISEIQQNVADQLPSSLLDQWNALRYVNMLGNFRTQVRNVAGNVGMQGVRAVKDKIALALEAVYHQINPNSERTKALTTSPELRAAARADYANVADVAIGEGKYQEGLSDGAFQRGVQDKRTIFKNNGTWGTEQGRNAFLRSAPVRLTRQAVGGAKAVMEGYRNATNWGMTQGDVLFTRYTYTRALAGYLKTHGVTAEQFSSPDWKAQNSAFVDKARMYAIQEAQEATFRDNNVLSNWVSHLGRKSSTPRGVRIAAEGLAPFRKTPANVLVRAEEYSPLGFFNTLYEIRQARRGNTSSADVINSLAKALTGTGLMAAGWALAAGLIPGLRLRASDDDDDQQKQFDSMTGRQAYSVEGDAWTLDVFGRSLEIPDWSYTLDWLTPGSMPLFMGAEFARLAEEDGLTLSDLEPALTSIAEPLVQMSMLQGVNDTLNDLKYSSDNLGQLAVTLGVSYLTQGLTNTLLGQIERTFEDTRQMTYADKNSPVPSWLQRQTGKASAKTPGWDYHQTEYINPWGQTESSGTLPARAAENFLSPGFFSIRNSGGVESELQRLADATGDTSVFPAYFDRSFEIDGVTKYMSADEYTTFAKTVGQTRYSILQSLVRHQGYKKLSDKDKAETISAVYKYANEVGKSAVSDFKMSDTYRELLQSPMDPATFFLYKRMMSIENDKKQTSAQANANVRNALKNDSSLTAKEKNILDDWIISDVTIIPQDKDADYSSDDSFTVSQMSDSAQRHWEYVRDRTGISSSDYQTAWSICNRSEKGYHKEDRIRDLMDQLGLSKPEATRLWTAVKADLDK